MLFANAFWITHVSCRLSFGKLTKSTWFKLYSFVHIKLSAQKQWNRFRMRWENYISMVNNNNRHNTTKAQVKAIVCVCMRAFAWLVLCRMCINIWFFVFFLSSFLFDIFHFICFILESNKIRLYSWHVKMHVETNALAHKYRHQFYLNES